MAQAVPQVQCQHAAGETVALGPWFLCAQKSNAINDPAQLDGSAANWMPAHVPGTVAAALQSNGHWDIRQPLDSDASDWWYRTAFQVSNPGNGQLAYLCLDGLATLAEVWLNGQCLLKTDNMFQAYRIDVVPNLQSDNELVIGFRSLADDIAKKRSRPRWKTNLVQHQQLRWRRTSLLGRIPGWSPPVPTVGPWREVRIETGQVCLSNLHVVASLDGTIGVVTLRSEINSTIPIAHAGFCVGDHIVAVEMITVDGRCELSAKVQIPNAPLWWPHTHGDQPLLECSLLVRTANEKYTFSCGKIGFRNITANQDDGLAIQINDTPIYCRGACWTIADIVTLTGTAKVLAHDLRLARDAGMNMLRVGGTMVYESDAFYDLCDELGILVWQDFMFANMDYPVEDPEFAHNIEAEAIYQLNRLAKHPCVIVYCGNSEIEQQAAMLGLPRELWRNRWFAERLPKLCAEYHPGTAYVHSTPSGGVLPFHTSSGITHYYGIGAYLRSPRELRQANVKFTPECLAFANVPESETINEIMGGKLPAIHDPQWKQRVPRDTGAGWDFEDVRDHYLKQRFGVDPVELRCFDMPRYLQLSRVVTGEMMAQVFSEWRSSHSNNHGGLVWFFKDLWPGAGWGIIDSVGRPKAAYYYLRRLWANQQITITDEGLDGLHVHVINETAGSFRGTVEVMLLKDQHVIVARQHVACELRPRARCTLSADAVLGAFHDLTYAYRFGPPQHDAVITTLLDGENKVQSEAFYFVQQREPAVLTGVKLEIAVTANGDETYNVILDADRLLQSVNLSADGYLPDDNYFHLTPEREKVVCFRPLEANVRFQGYVEALNLHSSRRFFASNVAKAKGV